MPLSKTTTDHNEIRRWVEARSGKPVCVRRTGSATDAGVLRFTFPGYTTDKSLEEISWEEFFGKFDSNELALVYQEQSSTGETSNFNKLVKRSTAEAKSRPRSSRATKKPAAKSTASRTHAGRT